MPIYEYECTRCSFRFELKQSFNDKPESTCPICEGSARRIFSPVPIIFKGSGFYCTDYARSVNNTGDGRKPWDKTDMEETMSGTDEKKNDGSESTA